MLYYVTLGVVLLITGLLFKYARIKKNYLFGYRTFRSLRNETNWVYANQAMANYALVIGGLSAIAGLACWYFDLLHYRPVIFTTIGLTIISILIVERRLYKFEKTNQRREG